MPELRDFQRQQFELTAHIRDPARNPPPPGIEDRRLAVYRELLFNNISQLLSRTFRVLHRLYTKDRWSALIRDYFSTHRAHTPLFLEMPQEFLKYLQDERGTRAEDPPFLFELAHYEWVELALQIDPAEIDFSGIDPQADLLDGRPVLSPLAWPLAYSFPVHRISPDFRPRAPAPQPTFLVVYRDLEDKVRFMEINAVTARLLELLQTNPRLSGRAALAAIASEMPQLAPAAIQTGGAQALAALREKNIILGTRTS